MSNRVTSTITPMRRVGRRGQRGRRCPICKAPAAGAYRPFCSPRCAEADLGHWLTGTYRIPESGDDEGRVEPGGRADDSDGEAGPT